MNTKTYLQGTHRFFDDLVTMLVSLSSFALSIKTFGQGDAKNLDIVNKGIAMGGCTVKTDLRFFPHTIMPTILANSWPTQVELRVEPYESGMPDNIDLTLSSAGTLLLTGLIAQSSYLRYYETMLPQVKATYPGDVSGWPSVWNFGRVVRNAFAHGGKIHFTSATASGVCWNGLTYSPTDNGRQIMYQDIAQVEIIYLMEEMDAAI